MIERVPKRYAVREDLSRCLPAKYQHGALDGQMAESLLVTRFAAIESEVIPSERQDSK